jgi:hypothetical protein
MLRQERGWFGRQQEFPFGEPLLVAELMGEYKYAKKLQEINQVSLFEKMRFLEISG